MQPAASGGRRAGMWADARDRPGWPVDPHVTAPAGPGGCRPRVAANSVSRPARDSTPRACSGLRHAICMPPSRHLYVSRHLYKGRSLLAAALAAARHAPRPGLVADVSAFLRRPGVTPWLACACSRCLAPVRRALDPGDEQVRDKM